MTWGPWHQHPGRLGAQCDKIRAHRNRNKQEDTMAGRHNLPSKCLIFYPVPYGFNLDGACHSARCTLESQHIKKLTKVTWGFTCYKPLKVCLGRICFSRDFEILRKMKQKSFRTSKGAQVGKIQFPTWSMPSDLKSDCNFPRYLSFVDTYYFGPNFDFGGAYLLNAQITFLKNCLRGAHPDRLGLAKISPGLKP